MRLLKSKNNSFAAIRILLGHAQYSSQIELKKMMK